MRYEFSMCAISDVKIYHCGRLFILINSKAPCKYTDNSACNFCSKLTQFLWIKTRVKNVLQRLLKFLEMMKSSLRAFITNTVNIWTILVLSGFVYFWLNMDCVWAKNGKVLARIVVSWKRYVSIFFTPNSQVFDGVVLLSWLKT
jgi:hypothetical protein